MKLVSFQWRGKRFAGVLSADGRDVTPLAIDAEAGLQTLIEHLGAMHPMPAAAGPRLPLSAVQLEAPLPQPRRSIFCVGRNYRSHAQELSGSVFKGSDVAQDGWPMIFLKQSQCVIAPGAAIELPRGVSQQIDYEAELAVVIGRGGKNIARARALEYVFGYTIVNDVTARDLQLRHSQWDLGKNLDGFCPMGPILVTPDECDGTDTRVQLWVNEDLRQNASTRDMIFDIPTLIETCSRGITLLPGDIIATGTPAGVGMGMTPPQWLVAGDVVRILIDGIGELVNPVV